MNETEKHARILTDSSRLRHPKQKKLGVCTVLEVWYIRSSVSEIRSFIEHVIIIK